MADQRSVPVRAGVGGVRGVTRRGFLGAGLATMAAASGCGGGGDRTEPRRSGSPARPSSGTGVTTTGAADSGDWDLYFEDWPGYVGSDTVAGFESKTGLKMRRTEDLIDNVALYDRLAPGLRSLRTPAQDLISPTQWMADRLQAEGLLEPLDHSKLPNLANFDTSGFAFTDPGAVTSLPWHLYFTGIAYNREVTGRDLGSLADLFDHEFAGQVGFLTELRDTMGLLFLHLGLDPGQPSDDSFGLGFDALEKVIADGQVLDFTGNDYLDRLVDGSFAACMAWSGDIVTLTEEHPEIRFVFPEEGAMVSVDTFCIPRGANGVDAAHSWMNYVYDPEVAADLVSGTRFPSAVKGVREVLAARGGANARLLDSPVLFPDPATQARLHTFGRLDGSQAVRADERFARIIGV